MSLTAAVFVAVYAAGLALAFVRNPIFGLYAYMWAFYNHPPSRWWGDSLPDIRWSLIAAVVTMIAVAFSATSKPELRKWHESLGARLLIAFAAWMWIQTAWAVNTSYHIEGAILFTKYAVLFFLIHRLVADEKAFELFCWTHVGGCFLWGWIAYGTEVRGRFELALGPSVDDSNLFGFHMVTGLALAGFMFLGLSGWRRWLAFGSIPFILNAVILTASRSALLALVIAGTVGIVLGPKKYRARLLLCSVLGAALFLQLAQNDIFWERAATIGESVQAENAEEMEGSAASRIYIFQAGLEMFRDYPFGAGHRGNEVLSPQYVPEQFLTFGGVRSAHNTFIAVLVDQGLPGVIIFLLLLAWSGVRLLKLKALDANNLPPSVGAYRAAIGAGLAAYVVSGVFVNLLKSEVAVWLIVLLAVLDGLALRAIQAQSGNTPDPVRSGPLPGAMILNPAFRKANFSRQNQRHLSTPQVTTQRPT